MVKSKQKAAAESEGTIRCPCRYNQNLGEMIQCEDCMVWQHFTCVGIRADRVPGERFGNVPIEKLIIEAMIRP